MFCAGVVNFCELLRMFVNLCEFSRKKRPQNWQITPFMHIFLIFWKKTRVTLKEQHADWLRADRAKRSMHSCSRGRDQRKRHKKCHVAEPAQAGLPRFNSSVFMYQGSKTESKTDTKHIRAKIHSACKRPQETLPLEGQAPKALSLFDHQDLCSSRITKY